MFVKRNMMFIFVGIIVNIVNFFLWDKGDLIFLSIVVIFNYCCCLFVDKYGEYCMYVCEEIWSLFLGGIVVNKV